MPSRLFAWLECGSCSSEKVVSDKILFGSDYPAGQTPKEAAEAVRKLPVSESFKEKILGNNAAALLGLTRPQG